MTRTAGSAVAAAGVARVASSAHGRLLPWIYGSLLRGCGAPFGSGGTPFVGAQHAVMVGIQLVETLLGGAARALNRTLDIGLL